MNLLWFEDELKKYSDFGKALKRHGHTMCMGDWSPDSGHTISSGLRYLLESLNGTQRDRYPQPDLIILDSRLINDSMIDQNSKELERLYGSDSQLRDDVLRCLRELNGGAVLRFLARHVPHARAVYLSQYTEDKITEEHGGQILSEYPQTLVGYCTKSKGPEQLLTAICDLTGDIQRGLSLDAIREALPPDRAEFHLGSKEDGFQWSEAYRLALSDLISVGADRAWQFPDHDLAAPGMRHVTSEDPRFEKVLRSHKQLPRALILAEKGSGKEGFTRTIHRLWYSDERSAPLVSVNIGGVPPWTAGLALQLRLYGGQQSEKGEIHHGCVPKAWGGSLFLDELGDAKPDVQDTLLRLIQEGEYEPALWNPELWAAHCCFIGATNRDLWGEDGFRADVADRLAMHVIRLPPLRETPEDIGLWMAKIARHNAERHTFGTVRLPPEFDFIDAAASRAQEYAWPGNIRELSHTIRRMQLRSSDGPSIRLSVVATELASLMGKKSAVAVSQLKGLPLGEAQWKALSHDLSTSFRRHGLNNVSQEDVVRHIQALLKRKITKYKLIQHFDMSYGPGSFHRLVEDVASAAGIRLRGAGTDGESD